MYNKTSSAQVTPRASTDVFVGHGSMIVTVLSETEMMKIMNYKKFEIETVKIHERTINL